MAKTMRAAVFSDFGGPDVVAIRKVPIPEPAAGEVRVKIEAAAMNHLDLWVRRGLPIETPMPHIGGSDFAGTVDAVGPGAESVRVGTRVVVDPSLRYRWYDGQDRGPSSRSRRSNSWVSTLKEGSQSTRSPRPATYSRFPTAFR